MGVACELKSLADQACPVPRIDRLIIVSPPEGRESSMVCDDAWRTIGHAIHPTTEIDWNNTPDPLRIAIESMWRDLEASAIH
jgi:hypothetical protein